MESDGSNKPDLRETFYRIIFGHETRSGKTFDVALIVAIIASVVVVMLDSTKSVRDSHGVLLRQLEWGFTGCGALAMPPDTPGVSSVSWTFWQFFQPISVCSFPADRRCCRCAH